MQHLARSTPAQRKLLRGKVREESENSPGVYRFLGEAGEVLYVGKSRRLRTRLLSYFRARGRRNKSAYILRHAFNIEWEYAPTEFGALLNELRLIKQLRPWFNSQYVSDEWPRAWIAITDHAVPALRVVPRSDGPGAKAVFGPFRKVAYVREAVRVLATVMHVRDCALPGERNFTMPRGSAATGRSLKPGCFRYELGSCPGPCIGEGVLDDYTQAVGEVHAFLSGRSDTPVRYLRAAMQDASQAMEFERAARLRDQLGQLEWLNGRLRAFRSDADRLTFRYHTVANDGSEWVYYIRRGTLRAAHGNATVGEIAELDKRVFGNPDSSGKDIPLHDLDEFYLVASWFRRHPEELKNTVLPAGYPAGVTVQRVSPDSAPSAKRRRSSRKAP